MLKIQKRERNSLYINNFNINKGGVLKSNYTRINNIYITGTKKYLYISAPEHLVFCSRRVAFRVKRKKE